MTRTCLAHTLLLSNLACAPGDFRDGFGTRPGVAFATLAVALVDDASMEDVGADGGEAECLGGEVDGADGFVGEVFDVHVEAVGEGDGAWG